MKLVLGLAESRVPNGFAGAHDNEILACTASGGSRGCSGHYDSSWSCCILSGVVTTCACHRPIGHTMDSGVQVPLTHRGYECNQVRLMVGQTKAR
eukprot:2965475-Amphidinium_carterae.1